MRRIALLGVLIVLPGCSGFGDFFGDAHSFTWNPNRPIGDSENIRRVRGEGPQLPPLTPEPGNVWPGPVPPEPTLSDLEKSNQPLGTTNPPEAPVPRQPRPRGSSTPPDNNQPGLGALPNPGVPPPPATVTPGASSSGRTYQTPRGPATGTRTQGPIDTLTGPGRNGSIVVPNGNGTSTVIGPDGSITTVPTPK